MKYNSTVMFKNGSEHEHEIYGFEYVPQEFNFAYFVTGMSKDRILIEDENGKEKSVPGNAFKVDIREARIITVLYENGNIRFRKCFNDEGKEVPMTILNGNIAVPMDLFPNQKKPPINTDKKNNPNYIA